MKSTILRLIPLFLIVLLIQACGTGDDRRRIELTPPEPYDLSTAVKDTTTDKGLKIYVIEEGTGRSEVNFRDQVQVRYTGRIVKEDGSLGEAFDSSFRNGSTQPSIFQNLTPVPKASGNRRIDPLIDGFRLGIIGFKSGLTGMVEGEKRTIIVPPELGYGKSDDNDTGHRLQDKTLRFDVELVAIL